MSESNLKILSEDSYGFSHIYTYIYIYICIYMYIHMPCTHLIEGGRDAYKMPEFAGFFPQKSH